MPNILTWNILNQRIDKMRSIGSWKTYLLTLNRIACQLFQDADPQEAHKHQLRRGL